MKHKSFVHHWHLIIKCILFFNPQKANKTLKMLTVLTVEYMLLNLNINNTI